MWCSFTIEPCDLISISICNFLFVSLMLPTPFLLAFYLIFNTCVLLIIFIFVRLLFALLVHELRCVVRT